jgi:Tfp pilus assembly ATPase PilU
LNYASKILDHLTQEDRFSQVLMVAGAPAVEKTNGEVRLILNTILTSDDIQETLSTFASHCRRRSSSQIGSHGVFAFGIPDRGRFRVHHLTQRGSLTLTIQRMPFDIPKVATESFLKKGVRR